MYIIMCTYVHLLSVQHLFSIHVYLWVRTYTYIVLYCRHIYTYIQCTLFYTAAQHLYTLWFQQVGYVMQQQLLLMDKRAYLPPKDPDWALQWSLVGTSAKSCTTDEGMVSYRRGTRTNIEYCWIHSFSLFHIHTLLYINNTLIAPSAHLYCMHISSISCTLAPQ